MPENVSLTIDTSDSVSALQELTRLTDALHQSADALTTKFQSLAACAARAVDAAFGDEGEEEPLAVGLSEIDIPSRWDHFAAAALTGVLSGMIAAGKDPDRNMAAKAQIIADDMLTASDIRRGRHDEINILLHQKRAMLRDIGLLLGQIDAACEADGQISNDQGDIAIIEQIRADWKDSTGEDAR